MKLLRLPLFIIHKYHSKKSQKPYFTLQISFFASAKKLTFEDVFFIQSRAHLAYFSYINHRGTSQKFMKIFKNLNTDISALHGAFLTL